MTRTINSPGYELNELDRSQYNRKINNSLPNAPICLIMGYSDKGADYEIRWINTKETLDNEYGYPKTEEQRYFYNGVLEILNKSGICIAAKLPYNNFKKQKYSYVDYNVENNDISSLPQYLQVDLADLNQFLADGKFTKISTKTRIGNEQCKCVESGCITTDELNKLLSNTESLAKNTIRFVDITQSRFSKSYQNVIQNIDTKQYTNDWLGIVPLIVSPINAMYFQHILSETDNNYPLPFNVVSKIIPRRTDAFTCYGTEEDNLKLKFYDNADYYIPLTTSNEKIDFDSLSKSITDYFPLITFKNANQIDTTYLKNIGVVVVKLYNDVANNNKINFQILESFVGSIDKNNDDQQYIGDVVNNNSQYINMFLNLDDKEISDSKIAICDNQLGVSLGFYDFESNSDIFKLTPDIIYSDINKVLSKISNTISQTLNIVIDAGISDIVYRISTENKILNWRYTQEIFDNFCKHIRKDCMFISDCFGELCLNCNKNDSEQIRNYTTKIINNIITDKTVLNTIVPKFKNIPKLNSSYSAGYCNWYLVQDSYSNKMFWLPPSIKAAGVYIYCSIYQQDWTAPAGINNATLTDVYDCAFTPNQKEADYIYLNGWNYAVNYPLNGIVIEGQKTFQSEQTALDRINVRRLMLWIEKRVVNVSRYFVYENNTAFTRQRFVDQVTEILDYAKSHFGISEYAVKCDDENNTPTTIDHNELHIKIAVKPIKTIEFIVISYVLTNQYANVNEEVIK